MLTIKQITSGGECLMQAKEVALDNAAPDHGGAPLLHYLEGAEWKEIVAGTVYVMNDTGATVARYFLDETPTILGGPGQSAMTGVNSGSRA